MLKAELRALGSRFMAAADACRVPAGKALAVDREAFAAMLTALVASQPRIRRVERNVCGLDDPVLAPFRTPEGTVVIAAGPLASEELSASLAAAVGAEHCYFYDAIAPIVWTHSLDMSVSFALRATARNRGRPGEGDYLNCPTSREEYSLLYCPRLRRVRYRPTPSSRSGTLKAVCPLKPWPSAATAP